MHYIRTQADLRGPMGPCRPNLAPNKFQERPSGASLEELTAIVPARLLAGGRRI